MALVHSSSVASMVPRVHCLVGCWIAYLAAVVVVVLVVVVAVVVVVVVVVVVARVVVVVVVALAVVVVAELEVCGTCRHKAEERCFCELIALGGGLGLGAGRVKVRG